MSEKKLKIIFVTLDGYGHLNSCIGVAEKLLERGHRTIFALERAWTGKAAKYPGIEERIFIDKQRQPNLDANEHWKEFMLKFKENFGQDPFDALDTTDTELDEKFINTMLNVDEEIQKIINDVQPDCIVVDSYTTIPAVYKSGIPWIWLTSAHPLSCLPSDNLPPSGTDYPTNGNREQWKKYLEKRMNHSAEIIERYLKRLKNEFGLDPPPMGSLSHPSPYLNIYAYPQALDYLDIRPLPDKWQNFEHFIRFTEKNDPEFKIPDEFLKKPLGKLIYVSMGSMGCADTSLMKRLIKILSKSPNRFIFSLGYYVDELRKELTDNMWGEKFLPQMQLIPLVDLVITHGGNNTVLETLYYGKPMIVTPLFGDQFNNSQRIDELGLGTKLNAYKCTEEEFLQKIDQLLNDQELKKRLELISKQMQSSNSTEKVAIAIEQIVEQNSKKSN